MTRVWTSPLGGYPRNRAVRRLLRDYEMGLVSREEVELALLKNSSVIIGAQLASGMDYVTDGMLDWHDPFRPFVSAWRNVTASELLRYFDNNFFYRVPVFTGLPEANNTVWPQRVKSLRQLAEPAGFKVVLPGPITFASLSKNASGKSFEELAYSIAKLLAREARASVEAGCSFIQIDEPFLSDLGATRDHGALAAELASLIAKESEHAKTALAIYFGVPKPEVYEQLLASRVSCISIDVIDSLSDALKLVEAKGFPGYCPVLGLVNSRTIYDDDLAKLADLAVRLARGQEELGLTTSTWLDLIPYEYSIKKTRLLGALAEIVRGALR
ncbi:MAG: methylcobalamin--homocysteine methyltransferase [Acidilobaceae archaeon]